MPRKPASSGYKLLSPAEALAIAKKIHASFASLGATAVSIGALAAGNSAQSAKALDSALMRLCNEADGADRGILETAAQWFHYHSNMLSDLARGDASLAAVNSKDRTLTELSLARLLLRRAQR